MWGHKIYTLFGILFIAFIMLFIVTSFITVALIYFQVNVIHHQPPNHLLVFQCTRLLT